MSTTLDNKPPERGPEKMAYKLYETAEALSLSQITVRRLVERGLLKPCRNVRHLLFSREEINRFLSQ